MKMGDLFFFRETGDKEYMSAQFTHHNWCYVATKEMLKCCSFQGVAYFFFFLFSFDYYQDRNSHIFSYWLASGLKLMLSYLSSYCNLRIPLAVMLRQPHLSTALRLTAMIWFHLLHSFHKGHRKASARPVHASYQFQEILFFFFFF